MSAQQDQPTNDEQRSSVASSTSAWHAHIRSLGLSSLGEYRKWCRKHGFKFHRKKSWRQEREERRVAEQERSQAAALQHIRALGLKTVEEYQEWCRRHGFRDALDKKSRQRQKERQFAEKEQADAAAELSRAQTDRATVSMEQIRALGLTSVEEYQSWSLENGPGAALGKKPEPLSKERALATLAAAKRQMGRSRHVIEQIACGELADDQLKTILLRKIHAGFAGLDEDGRQALLSLLLHVERSADLLNITRGAACWGRRPGNTFVEGLIGLARYHREWLRPVAAWRPGSRNQHTQFGTLVRHLLARYEVPAFMDVVWFRGDDGEARRQQNWFRQIGAGQNIRTADVPVRLSKKMAHHFLQAPAHCTVEEALRWGQVLGQGGSPLLAAAINGTRLGRALKNEKFWSTVIHFFTRYPALDLARIGPIVDYIHHQKYVLRESAGPGGGEACDLPLQPNFSMKSRSVPKLLRQVDQWQERWSLETLQPESPKTRFQKSPFAFFYCEEVDERSGRTLHWTIQQLTTSRALATEGDVMRHCVASYSSKLDKTSIWSLQVREGSRTHRVMTIAIDNEQCLVTQVRGRFNINPQKAFDAQATAWDGAPRGGNRLNHTDRDLLRRSHEILHLWLEREEIAYSQFGE